MAGRASKRTPENAAEIIQIIEGGGTKRLACAVVGMSEDTLALWAKADSELSDRLREAEGRRDRSLVALIQSAAPDDWKAAAWLLERVNRADYGTKVSTEISGPNGAAIEIARIEVAAPASPATQDES